MKIAGAPISWGVCEVPGWGYQLTPERVLAEMRDVGMVATELGPDGFLPSDPAAHDRTADSLRSAAASASSPRWCCTAQTTIRCPISTASLDAIVGVRGSVLVLAAATGADGYDARPDLDDSRWATLLANLDRLADAAAAQGVLAVLHPHVGTMVETRDEVARVLDGSSFGCAWTRAPADRRHRPAPSWPGRRRDRIAHAHLKDVDATLAAQRAGRAS